MLMWNIRLVTVTEPISHYRLHVGVVSGGSCSIQLLHAGGGCVPATAVPPTTQTQLHPGSTGQHLLNACCLSIEQFTFHLFLL